MPNAADLRSARRGVLSGLSDLSGLSYHVTDRAG